LALEARRPYGDTSMPDGGLLLVQNAAVAIMLSRGVTLAMLFFSDYALGRYAAHAHSHALLIGSAMLLFGAVLIGVVMALGG
jgi:hypothetical protein